MKDRARGAYIRLSAAARAQGNRACLDGRHALAAADVLKVHSIIMLFTYQSDMEVEDKPARFTILIDADKKKAFDDLCAAQDVTSSQMIRQLIREYLDKHGVDYTPGPLRTKKQRRKVA
jgi:hypothetical protein